MAKKLVSKENLESTLVGIKEYIDNKNGCDWEAQEGEDGYIKNKPFGLIGGESNEYWATDSERNTNGWSDFSLNPVLPDPDKVDKSINKFKVKFNDSIIKYGELREIPRGYEITDIDGNYTELNNETLGSFVITHIYEYNFTLGAAIRFSECTCKNSEFPDGISKIELIPLTEKKLDSTFLPIVQETGDSETEMMSQKAVTDNLNNLREEVKESIENIDTCDCEELTEEDIDEILLGKWSVVTGAGGPMKALYPGKFYGFTGTTGRDLVEGDEIKWVIRNSSNGDTIELGGTLEKRDNSGYLYINLQEGKTSPWNDEDWVIYYAALNKRVAIGINKDYVPSVSDSSINYVCTVYIKDEITSSSDKFTSKNNLATVYKDINEKIESKQNKLPDGEQGQVLTKTANGVEWKNHEDGEKWNDVIIKYPFNNTEVKQAFNNVEMSGGSFPTNLRLVVMDASNQILGRYTPYLTNYFSGSDDEEATLSFYFKFSIIYGEYQCYAEYIRTGIRSCNLYEMDKTYISNSGTISSYDGSIYNPYNDYSDNKLRIVKVDFNSDKSLRLSSKTTDFVPGEIHGIITNTSNSDIVITIPTSAGTYKVFSNTETITIPANGFGEINVIRTPDLDYYIRAI